MLLQGIFGVFHYAHRFSTATERSFGEEEEGAKGSGIGQGLDWGGLCEGDGNHGVQLRGSCHVGVQLGSIKVN